MTINEQIDAKQNELKNELILNKYWKEQNEERIRKLEEQIEELYEAIEDQNWINRNIYAS